MLLCTCGCGVAVAVLSRWTWHCAYAVGTAVRNHDRSQLAERAWVPPCALFSRSSMMARDSLRKRIMCLHSVYVQHLPTFAPTTPTLPAVIWRGLPPPTPLAPPAHQGDAGRPAAEAAEADAVWCAHASDVARCIRVHLRRPCTACRESWSSSRRCRIAHGGPPARCSQSAATEMNCPIVAHPPALTRRDSPPPSSGKGPAAMFFRGASFEE